MHPPTRNDRRWNRDFALREIANMPPLRHTVPGFRFDIMQSEVAAWLCDQPAVRQWVFNIAKREGVIQLDLAAGKWIGANYPRNRIDA